MQRNLPARVTLLFGLVFLFTVWNAVRLGTSILWHNTLETYAPRVGPLYIGITGGIWMLAGLFIFWAVWRGIRQARLIFMVTAGLYAAWIWADRLWAQTSLRANWPFDLLLTAILLVYTAVVVLDPRNRPYFEREVYERESEDRPIA